ERRIQLNNGVVEPCLSDGGEIEFKPHRPRRSAKTSVPKKRHAANAELAEELKESDAELEAKAEVEEVEVVAKRMREMSLRPAQAGRLVIAEGEADPYK
ncbi:MAG: hypothetical protein CYPHOPRED_005133, partial [Cyphobasidiales sp. Tagirdzhanova-0007]